MRVVVIDYGMGNLPSVAKAFEHIGADVHIGECGADLRQADSIILPGVGAFGDAMHNLKSRGLVEPLAEALHERQLPFLGICLGMQLLAQTGYEHGEHQGLNIIKGCVKKLDSTIGCRLPHVGWNNVQPNADSILFRGLDENTNFYFVHSYHLNVEQPDVIAAHCTYGQKFVAAIQRDNISAVQFHPEKSQKAGLQLLRNFVGWSARLRELAS